MKEYTFLWYIENLSYSWHKNGEQLASPKFTAEWLEGTVWYIGMWPRGWRIKDKSHVSLFLCRSIADDGPEKFSVQWESSALAADGSPLCIVKSEAQLVRGTGTGSYSFLETDEILLRRKADYLSQDILTLQCKICIGKGKVRNIEQSTARTRIKVEKLSFLQVVENFSTLQPNVKQTMKIRLQSKEERFITSSLYFTEGLCCEEKIMIEIVPSDTDHILRKCEIYLLDASGNGIDCGKVDNRYDTEIKDIRTLPLSLTRQQVLNRKSEYLPGDKLSLLCKCSFSCGLEFNTIEETVHEMPLDVLKKATDVSAKNACEAAENPSAYPSALDDMKALYIDMSLTDIELKTKTKSFPAHKSVLCARSPVFKKMMISDMREKNTDCIEIGDLEDDVVHQLLLFLYSDIVENLQWEMATRMYYAADKYEIGKLKAICSCFLLENLSPATAGELLLLSDTHSDANLKKSVEDFILKHEEQVFGSDEWERLMETNPLLFMKVMLLKHKRRKGSK